MTRVPTGYNKKTNSLIDGKLRNNKACLRNISNCQLFGKLNSPQHCLNFRIGNSIQKYYIRLANKLNNIEINTKGCYSVLTNTCQIRV